VNGMNGKVLIVDDCLTVRMDLAEAFEATGIRSLPCSSIREARGLWTGANDYVGKPYDTGYVVARAQEVMRRRQNENQIPGTLGPDLKGTP
jgi:hypothetical protein